MRNRPFVPRDRKRHPERASVISYCAALGIPYTTPSQHQIKVADLSFYPSTGTIVRDCQGKLKVVGSAAFIQLIEKAFWR